MVQDLMARAAVGGFKGAAFPGVVRPVLGRVASLGDAHSGNSFQVSSWMFSVISGEPIAFNFCGSITGEDHWLARSRHRWANCHLLPP